MAEKTDRKVTAPIHMLPAENSRNIWRVFVANGTTPQDIVQPQFWAHLASRLQAGDRIEVEPEDSTWLAELRVIDSGPQYAKVQIRKPDADGVSRFEALGSSDTGLPSGYSFSHNASSKWRVVRDSDQKVLKDGLATKADAVTWLMGFAKVLAA